MRDRKQDQHPTGPADADVPRLTDQQFAEQFNDCFRLLWLIAMRSPAPACPRIGPDNGRHPAR